MSKFFSRFFSQKTIKEGQEVYASDPVILSPVYRQKNMSEEARKKYATELLDTYAGFGSPYLAGYIQQSINNQNIKNEMLKIVRCLPLLKKFVNSISRIYAVQPARKFYLNGKRIVKELEKGRNEDGFVVNEKLYEILNNIYSDKVNNSIKQSENYTNLLSTTIYKVITNDKGEISLVFLPNDLLQVNKRIDDSTKAEQIAYVQDVENYLGAQTSISYKTEIWNAHQKTISQALVYNDMKEGEPTDNLASAEYEKLFGTREAGDAFAPFVVFHSSGDYNDFWDLKDNDIVAFIKSINMSLTELRYLEKFTSFSLKYAVNLKLPENGVMDATGFLDLSIQNNSIPGIESGKNWDIGEFRNEGRIDEVIRSIIFNLKMLYTLYDIPLDALISTNSVRSAESKEMDNENLLKTINAQRDVWQLNEQNLFKVMCAVYNRDNQYQIPKGVKLIVDFDEKEAAVKTQEEWLVEIQNNVRTYIDWLSELNPDLDHDELINLFKENKELNEGDDKEEKIDLVLAESENKPINDQSINENELEDGNNQPNQ